MMRQDSWRLAEQGWHTKLSMVNLSAGQRDEAARQPWVGQDADRDDGDHDQQDHNPERREEPTQQTLSLAHMG
jgi:hypothetical protein